MGVNCLRSEKVTRVNNWSYPPYHTHPVNRLQIESSHRNLCRSIFLKRLHIKLLNTLLIHMRYVVEIYRCSVALEQRRSLRLDFRQDHMSTCGRESKRSHSRLDTISSVLFFVFSLKVFIKEQSIKIAPITFCVYFEYFLLHIQYHLAQRDTKQTNQCQTNEMNESNKTKYRKNLSKELKNN